MLDEAEQDRLITEQNQDIIRVANGIFQALTRNKDQKINRDASIIIEAHLKPGDNHEAQIAASLASLTEKFKSDLSLSSTYQPSQQFAFWTFGNSAPMPLLVGGVF